MLLSLGNEVQGASGRESREMREKRTLAKRRQLTRSGVGTGGGNGEGSRSQHAESGEDEQQPWVKARPERLR